MKGANFQKKKRAPYNAYVAKERQKKYFTAKKQQNKWNRQKKHIMKEMGISSDAGDRNGAAHDDGTGVAHEDPHDKFSSRVDEDAYERDLAFPSVKKSATTATSTSNADASTAAAETSAADKQKKKKKRKTNGNDTGAAPGTAIGKCASAEQNASTAASSKVERKTSKAKMSSAKSSSKADDWSTASYPAAKKTRFSKVLQQQKEEERRKQQELHEKLEQEKEFSKKRRITKNKRFTKNHLRENQRNKKGQPRMSNILKSLMMAKGHSLQ